MTLLAASWGLGYAALWVAAAAYGWHTLRTLLRPDPYSTRVKRHALLWTGHALSGTSAALIWLGLWIRAQRGHGWPVVSPADAAGGVALVILIVHTLWALIHRRQESGLLSAAIALGLLSYSLAQFPRGLITLPLTAKASLLSDGLNLSGAGLLALAASTSMTHTARAYAKQRSGAATDGEESEEQASEVLVRVALFCLAASLAIDTWWLQKVGFGTEGDAQQAGIAVAWMVYFAAMRLRSSARWRGWPWASVLAVGFVCTLPILINAAWLDAKLPI